MSKIDGVNSSTDLSQMRTHREESTGSSNGRKFTLSSDKGKIFIALMVTVGLGVGIYFLVQHIKSQHANVQHNSTTPQPIPNPQAPPQPLGLRNIKLLEAPPIEQPPIPTPGPTPTPAPSEHWEWSPGGIAGVTVAAVVIVVVIVVAETKCGAEGRCICCCLMVCARCT